MTFILSKLLLFFLHPFLWVLALMLCGAAAKNQRKSRHIFIAAVVVLFIFSDPFLLNRFAAWWDYKRPALNSAKSYSCAIILGGFASEDAEGRGYFNGSADRFIQGLRLKATGQAAHLLITGGNASINPDHFSEGNWVAGELKVIHMPDTAVLIESHARNTDENARYSKMLLSKARLQPPYLLVTSAFHMRRALAVFQHEGVAVIPYAGNFGGNGGSITADDFIPAASVMDGWTLYFKEVIGLLIVKLKS